MQPAVRTCDVENRFPSEVHAAAHDHGLTNVCIPSDLGGQGKSQRMIAIGGEELASVCAPMAFTLGFNHGALQPVLRAGTSEQKQVFVRNLLRDRKYASLCMTEPDTSGSTLLSMQTKARNSDSGWVINGRKCMIGVGTEASVFFVFAETETNGTQRGISVFAVPRGPGVEVGENTDKIGFRCVPTPSITFTDVHVPEEHLIGTIGTGDLILLQCLDYMRFGGVSVILGLTVGGLRDIVPVLEQRQVSLGEKLSQKSNIQMALGSYYSEVQSVRLLLWRAAKLIDDGLPYGSETAMAKFRASELAIAATQDFVRFMGWRGLDADYPAQKRLRDAMATSIFEGSNDVLKLKAYRDLCRQIHSGEGL
jgi:alkylation response protein AidB-like acyl-CoA dehydrogenase